MVIDVLRACTTIIYALSQGCSAVYPCATVSAARELYKRQVKRLGKDGVLLGGERDGIKVKGFHLGNSPGEYSAKMVRGKTLIFTTTNCTKNLTALNGPEEVIICSFINLPAVAEYLSAGDRDVLLALSGTDGQMSAEDTVCGGMIIHELLKGREVALSASARAAYTLYLHHRDSLPQAVIGSNHGIRLLELGFKDDIDFCARVGEYEIIPRYIRGKVSLQSG